ncbi:MAG: tRNA (cytidine(34)-2'-O)-methyltransferase [Paracoccaceae bacterium]
MRLAVFEPDIAPNLGAMIRLCACLGVPLDVIEPCGFPFSPKALRRSAMDYADLAEIAHHDSWRSFIANRHSGRLVLLTTGAAAGLWGFSFRPADTLVVGRESAGVPRHVHQNADARLAIPMPGGGRSLNVTHAAAIALGEAQRQLSSAGEP